MNTPAKAYELIFQDYGEIRVGRIKYVNGKPVQPKFEGFTPIVVMTKSSEYGDLGPYVLKNDEGHIMENIWQFSKLYPWVPASKQTYSRFDKTVIWDHPQETHVKDGKPTEKYWQWRQKGMENPEPVRYPVGNGAHKRKCICVLSDCNERLGIAEGRKQVYLKTYSELVKKEPKFVELVERCRSGENLLIIEVDGPHQETLGYYKEKYGIRDDFITDDTILVTPRNMKIMLNDPKHSFGHGYCLAMAIYGWA